MAKKNVERIINIDNILFNCRDYLRAARNSGSFFKKRDMMLTLVFLRFIGKKYEDDIEKLRQALIKQGLDPDDDNIHATFFDDATFTDGTYNLPPEARWSTIINTPAPGLNVALDTALHSIATGSKQLKGCFVEGTFTTRNLGANDIKKLVDEVNKISHKAFGQEKHLTGRVYEYFLKEFAVNATKEEGEYYTPHDVVQLIATLIEPYDSRKAFSANATELRQALNAPLEFEIIEEIPDGEKSKYAGCIVDICRPDALVDENWTAILDKDGRASLDATILGYMQAGIPTQLRLWNKGDDEFEDAPILTQTFKVTEKVTVISLGNTGIDAKWFEGSWRYGDNIAFTIEIVDDQNCKHIGTLDGEAVIHETTYVFDPATASLTMAYSPGQVSLLETVYYGETYEGVDYIEIKRTSGSTVYERAK